MSDIAVRCTGISKRFFVLQREKTTFRILKAFIRNKSLKKEYWALRDISFELKKSEKLGVVGSNGAGKTTLLRILAGIYRETSGSLEVAVPPIALFKYWIGLNNDLSFMDNIYLFGAIQGIARPILDPQVDNILTAADLFDLKFGPLRELSTGQRQRLALSVFFRAQGDFLIFDESLSFIDKAFYNKCENYFNDLAGSSKTVIIASHDIPFLRKYCTKAIWLDRGNIRKIGDIDMVADAYELFCNSPDKSK